MNTFTFSIALIILCCVQLMCEEGVSYKFTRNGCNKFNRKFVYKTSCRIRPFNRTAAVTNTEVLLQPNISLTNIRMDLTTYRKFTTVYRPSLIKYSEFICEALNNGKFSHFVAALRESYAKTSNVFNPCPKSGKLYLYNTTVNTSKFPQFWPVGEYRVDCNFFTYMNGEEEFIMLYQSYMEVKPLGALQF